MAKAWTDDEPVLEVSCNESFTHGLLHAMWGMKDRAEMTDFTIKLNNLTIPCHSVVIAAVSDYFHTLLLRKEMREAKARCVELKEMDGECLQRVVEYCYTGKINVQLSAANACLNIAHYLRITPLVDQLEAFVSKHLRPDNVIGWYMRADKLQLQELLAASNALMLASFTDVVKHREFHQLTATELQDYIAQKSNNADAVLDACVSWAQYNVEARCDNFMELLQYIQLDDCSLATLQAVLHSWKPSWPNYKEVQNEIDMTIALIVENNLATFHCPLSFSSHSSQVNRFKILMFGGYTEKNCLNRDMWKMDLKAGTFAEMGKIANHAVKYRNVCCSSQIGILVVGGSKALNAERYESTEDTSILSVPDFTWRTARPSHLPISSATPVRVNHLIYIFGGFPPTDDVQCFNTNTMRWALCASMPFENVYPIAGAVCEKVYVVFHTVSANKQYRPGSDIPVYCFNSKKRKWSPRRSLPASVCECTWGAHMLNVKDQLFMVGGMHRLCLEYSPLNYYWTRLTRPSHVQRAFSAVHVESEIVMVGGFDENEKCHGIIQVYDIATDTWSLHRMLMPVPLKSHHCAVYDGNANLLVP